jgi:DNA polymerase-1
VYGFHAMPSLVRVLGTSKLWHLFRTVEMPLAGVLAKIYHRGMALDLDSLAELQQRLRLHRRAVKEQLYGLSGRPFNVAAPKEVGEFLQRHLQPADLAPLKSRGSRVIATDKESLQALEQRYPAVQLLLAYRSLSHMKAMAQALRAAAGAGRIHPNLSAIKHENGRLTAAHPNILAVPNDLSLQHLVDLPATPSPLSLRSAFIATPGRLFARLDYSQIEFRLMAHFSQDPLLTRAFSEDRDVFANLAGFWLQKNSPEVSELERKHVKQICYGIAYGMSAPTLVRKLRVDAAVAEHYRASFMQKFPSFLAWTTRVIQETERLGFVQTLAGRRRTLPGIRSRVPAVRAEATRQAVNTLCQGSAADIIKAAMVTIDAAWPQLPLVLQLHDELIFELSEQQLPLAHEIASLMETALADQLSIPLTVTIHIGRCWSARSAMDVLPRPARPPPS